MRGRLAFHGGIGGDDQFLHFAFGQALVQLVQAELATATAERMRSGNRTIEVIRMKITDAGRQALGERR